MIGGFKLGAPFEGPEIRVIACRALCWAPIYGSHHNNTGAMTFGG